MVSVLAFLRSLASRFNNRHESPKPLRFLFLDDSYFPSTNITSLTAVAVPVDRLHTVRTAFYDTLKWAIRPSEGVIARAPELHGSNFLRDESPERQTEVLLGLQELIRANALGIYRIGYFLTRKLAAPNKGDPKMIGMLWVSLLSMLEPILAEGPVIPVMDGFDPRTVRQLSQLIKSVDEMRAAGYGSNSISIAHAENVLGEVFYADSKFSALTQVADVVSYLRGISDMETLGIPLTDFKEHLAPHARALTGLMTREEVVSMVLNGEIQGPRSHVKPVFRNNGPITRMFNIVPSDTENVRCPADLWM